MEEKKEEILYKIVLLGDYDAGKTRFIRRYVGDIYDSNMFSTIEFDFKIKRVTLNDGKTAKIQIWDTASGERYKFIIANNFRGAKGFIIMYNIAWRKSFEIAKEWLKDLRDYTDTNNIALVGNYVNEEEDSNSYYNSNDYYYIRKISTEEGQKFAEDNNLLFFETSIKTGHNVNECFDALINRIYENDPNKGKHHNKIKLKLEHNRIGKKGCLK